MSFNGALREILPTATKQTTKDLKYFCQMTRNEEKKAQDVLNAATAFCHLQRILGSVFTMTNVLYYARNNNVGLETIISSLPDFIYYMVALCIFYCLGNRYAVQMNLTKEVIQSTECTNEDAENEASLDFKISRHRFGEHLLLCGQCCSLHFRRALAGIDII
ncbi:hypothetical protein FHG87_006751 [Trinorchestia longiramus]|nr:hypothetical protein FHG87_006751 [Trinorchestia longiramus]